ncbi:hypothetical protein BU15DRAFT_43237 [Melanogaster broomeanus]|nr:hypothetical protein BU15DRAFT_43261 [Melanogaster broomeanus]KAF9243080.1 hypothetical protein BU15DRAFT_43237 [Melanogaster broomeanus]
MQPLHTNVHLGKRKRRAVDFDPFVVPRAPKRQQPAKMNEFTLWMKLDSFVQPGLTDKQLKSLLVRCECGLTMTRRVYDDHECFLALDHEVIDLTCDDSDAA